MEAIIVSYYLVTDSDYLDLGTRRVYLPTIGYATPYRFSYADLRKEQSVRTWADAAVSLEYGHSRDDLPRRG